MVNIDTNSVEAVQISSTQLIWAPPLEYPGGLPDITVHTMNNIWQYLDDDELGVGYIICHFSHPRMVRTVYPARDELERLANSVVASVRSEIEPFNDRLKGSFKCLKTPWRNPVDLHHYAWSFATQVTAFKMKTHTIRREPNPLLTLWD